MSSEPEKNANLQYLQKNFIFLETPHKLRIIDAGNLFGNWALFNVGAGLASTSHF